jgi:hypothetical protein
MLFDYYCLGLRYLVMMTAMIVTTATQKNKIKNQTCFFVFIYLNRKQSGKEFGFS